MRWYEELAAVIVAMLIAFSGVLGVLLFLEWF